MNSSVFMTASTDTTIFKLIQLIFNVWNNKEYVTGLFCDLTKAFESVGHELLILNLVFMVPCIM